MKRQGELTWMDLRKIERRKVRARRIKRIVGPINGILVLEIAIVTAAIWWMTR